MRIDRRSVLVGGGAAGALVVAYALWPRAHRVSLPTAPGEFAFGGWLKIGSDGHVTVAVPQCEHGQGVYTALPQIAADELGADWRTVGVEAAPESGAFGNPIAARALFGDAPPAWLDAFTGGAPMLTGGSSSVLQFEAPLRRAGAVARALLCKAAARQLGGDWRDATTAQGFVSLNGKRLRFGAMAEAAANESVPRDIPLRAGAHNRLTGVPAPRLDSPAKVDGSANFAGDIRLPNMVFAAIRQGPLGDSRLVKVDRGAAERLPGIVAVIENPRWVAVAAHSWWAANRALGALHPRFETVGAVDSVEIDRALAKALAAKGERQAAEGDLAAAFAGAQVFRAEYHAEAGPQAALEPVTATASHEDGKLILWIATQAPELARAAAARGAGISAASVVLHPMMAGGSFGQNVEVAVAEQVAALAVKLRRPVHLAWSRAETLMRAPVRAPARARMTARLGANGALMAWHAALATPAVGRALHRRIAGDTMLEPLARDDAAIAGAVPPYRIPAIAIDHHQGDSALPAGWTPGGAAVANCFFTECFLDELAHHSGVEPLSHRISMLGGAPRLARCLSTVASLGGWQGGIPGSGQGIAAYSAHGSHIALMVEGEMTEGGRPSVARMVAAADMGRMINPDLVRQAIERGLLLGLAAAAGVAPRWDAGLGSARTLRDLALPRLADIPDLTIELVESDEASGGASDLAVPVVAPALANAIYAGSGMRLRKLPL